MPSMSKIWLPPINAKQLAVFNNFKRFLLVSGPRRSSKTIGCAHKVARHAFDVNHARVSVFTKTIKVAKDGGCWTDLTEDVLPKWIEADIGMKWVTPPKVDGATRQPFCEILNRYGGVSKIVLNSVASDKEVEELTKGKKFTMVWVNELSNFKSRAVFDATTETLRHGRDDEQQWIADTNPADDGEQSWIWQLFYNLRVAENPPPEVESESDILAFRELQRSLDLIEIMIPDNSFLTEEAKRAIAAKYRHDNDLYERYVLGKWTSSSENSHFADVFRPEIHIIGNAQDLNPENWEIMLPEEECFEMITGWDLGSVNHSVHIIEPATIGGIDLFKVLDELVILNENIALADIAEEIMERMAYWQAMIKNPLKWRHWSDKSAFDHFRPSAEVYDHSVISSASNGVINLQAAPKYKDSLKHRVNLARRLLFEDRILVSAKCPQTAGMFRGLKKGDSAINFVDRKSRWKHPFDSLTYPISAELPLEMKEADVRTGRMVLLS